MFEDVHESVVVSSNMCLGLLSLASALTFWAAGFLQVMAQAPAGQIGGTIVDPEGHVLPGVTVTLEAAVDAPDARVVASTTTSETGQFGFSMLSAGTYTIIAERSGYARSVNTPVRVFEGQLIDVRISLAVAPLSEVVTVEASTRAGNPIEEDEIRADFLRTFQLPNDRFQEALPLLPGVIRDPRGRLSFNGTRPSQSTLLVNGANATDPVTGQFAVELPLSVIDTVEVHAIPYSAEFGRVSGAVASVRTLAGDDHWDVDFGNLMPTPRLRNGKLGINTASPRVRASGPLRRGKAWFSQAFSYRFARSRVRANIPGDDEEILEGFDTFTQVDVEVSDRHSMTGTLSFFTSSVEHAGIDSLTPALATPDNESGGWNVAVASTLATASNAVWQTLFAVRAFDVTVRPQGDGHAQLTPDGLRNNYFNHLDRHSRQVELNIARLQNWRRGTHARHQGGRPAARHVV